MCSAHFVIVALTWLDITSLPLESRYKDAALRAEDLLGFGIYSSTWVYIARS
jgi:hypothetical protein